MSLDLNKIENKLDEALSNETTETLNKILNDKRMTNNKQQTSVKWLVEQLQKTRDWQRVINEVNQSSTSVRNVIEQAEEMEGYRLTQRFEEGRELGQIEILASQATEKASTYADGYNEGYKRAFEYMIDAIKNKISPTDEP
jgi:uncharacterized coiled-coil protein SlyX